MTIQRVGVNAGSATFICIRAVIAFEEDDYPFLHRIKFYMKKNKNTWPSIRRVSVYLLCQSDNYLLTFLRLVTTSESRGYAKVLEEKSLS